MLSTYPWEAKLIKMLASLAINYGEFNFVFLKGLALKQILTIVPSFDNQKLSDNFIKSVLHLTKCIVDRKQLSYYSTPQSLNSTIPIASYWIGRSVLAYATRFAHLLMMGIK